MSSTNKIYPGINKDLESGITPTGNIIRDAWVFGIIPESEVIAEYLDDLYPERSLAGSSPRVRADVRLISRIGIPSRKCHRLITLNNATSITPLFSCINSMQEELYVGQNSMQIMGPGGSILGAI